MIPLARMPTGQQAFIFTLLCRSDVDEVAWVTISKHISFSTLATWLASTQVWGLSLSRWSRNIVIITFSVSCWQRRIESITWVSRNSLETNKNCEKPRQPQYGELGKVDSSLYLASLSVVIFMNQDHPCFFVVYLYFFSFYFPRPSIILDFLCFERNLKRRKNCFLLSSSLSKGTFHSDDVALKTSCLIG